MSKKDYTQFSNNSNKPVSDQVDAPIEVVKPIKEVEGVITNQIDEPVQEVKIVEPVKEVDVIEPVKEVKGVVINCARLNVRKEPEPKAEVLCTVDANCELMVDEANSTEDFYKVYTAAGIEGYCVKYFIAIIP